MTHYPIRIRRYTDPSAARVVRFASIVVAHTTVYARPLDATDLRCATALKTRDADSPLERVSVQLSCVEELGLLGVGEDAHLHLWQHFEPALPEPPS